MEKFDGEIINLAIKILDSQLKEKGDAFTSPQLTRNFLRLNLELLEHEVFAVMFLDNQHRLIEFKVMFSGTIDAASVYPREVVKAALLLNAAAVIFAHNHPSGISTPSRADRSLTERLSSALGLLDIRVLDHIIVGRGEMTSFAELGYL